MLLVVHGANDDGLVVNGVDVEREERALDSKDVPTGEFVTARHREETLTTNYTIPRLHLRRRG